MHKKLIVVLTLCLILLIALSAVVVYAADADLYKNLNETAQQSGNDYFVKYRDNYELDTEDMSFFKNPGSVMLNMLTSFVFLLQKMLAQLTIAIFSFALSTNIVEVLGGFLEPFITAMKSSLWDNLAMYAIGFAAFALLIKMAQNRTSQALSSLIGLLMIIVLAFMFYVYPIQMLEGVDTVTSGISDAVMEGPYQATVGGTAGDAKGKASALCWNLLVHKPWQIIEFGDVSTAQKYEADILKLKPDSDARQEKVNQLAESQGLFSKSKSFQGTRLCIASVTLVFNFILMAVLITFSVLIIGYRFLLLVYILLGIFVFLVALLPNFGIPLIRRWGMRVISISFTRVLVVFFLSITLVFMDVIYKFINEYGLFMVMFLMVVIIVVIWFERYRLLDLFTGFQTNGNQFQQGMSRSLDTDYNAIDHIRNLRRNYSQGGGSGSSGSNGGTGNMSSGNAGGKMTGNYGNGPGSPGSSSGGSSTSGSGGYNNNGNSSSENSGSFGSSSSGSGNGPTVSSGNSSQIQQIGQNIQQSADNLQDTTDDMAEYFKYAEDLLQKQYEYSKEKSEEAAAKGDGQVKYDDFVKRTEKIRENDMGSFDTRDLTNVANIIKQTVEQGGSVDDVVSDGHSIYRKKVVQRPESLDAINIEDSSDGEPVQIRSNSKAPKGIEYFRSNFGEEQGEEIFSNLQQKYGQEKLVDYRPFYNNNGKQTYAQVIKQLHENVQVGKPQKDANTVSDNKIKKVSKGIKPESDDEDENE